MERNHDNLHLRLSIKKDVYIYQEMKENNLVLIENYYFPYMLIYFTKVSHQTTRPFFF